MANLDRKVAHARILGLRKEIDHYRHAYHVLDKELISPEALDSLKKELFDLEQKFPEFITPDSPTQRVGGEPLNEFKKIRHEKPMFSLNDAFSKEDVRDWFHRAGNYLDARIKEDFYCNLKMDGLAIELVYKKGALVSGSTRGDGLIGEDVTNNLKTIEAIPLKLMEPRDIIVRGEVFLLKKEFERINKELVKEGKPVYANPRNLAAGTIRQLNPKVTARRKLNFYAYDVLNPEDYKTHAEVRHSLKELGFAINEHGKILSSLDEVFIFHERWEKERVKLPYEIDGVFLTLNNNDIYARLGIVGKAPRGAIAYKFSPKEAITLVQNIKVQIGRTGALTPVAELRPVGVGGVMISHATLHNFDEIRRLGLKIGDTVIVSRAGDVIPQVTKVLKDLRIGKEKEFKIPNVCPVDGSKVIKDGVIYRCSNKNCGAREREFLYHFVSRSAFNIRGLGQRIIDRFIDDGLISDAADIFTLNEGDIKALERFGEKSAGNIVAEIYRCKVISLERFIYSLGIFHVGQETSRLLAKKVLMTEHRVSQPKDIFNFFEKLTFEELQEIPDVGPVVAQSIVEYFKDRRHRALIEKLDSAGVVFKKGSIETQDSRFKNVIFILTGGLKTMTRDEAKDKIRNLGGTVSESVGKNTDFVVFGSEPGIKYEKAKKLGIKVINEQEFLKMLR